MGLEQRKHFHVRLGVMEVGTVLTPSDWENRAIGTSEEGAGSQL